MEEQKIKELVQRMKQGEQSAYEEVYRETCRSVYFICLGFMKNEENAKDAMQDTYMTAFSKLEQLKEEEKFIAWLKQIAVNRCKRLLEQTGPELMEAEDLENLKKEENENFLPEEYITNKAKRKIVMDIMRKKLSDIQYQTVILFYFNGLEIEEIADMMECPPGTVKSRLSVARNKIKEGVLEYEKESKDKLYSFVGIPFLTSLLAAEVSAMEAPEVWESIELSLKNLERIGESGANNIVNPGDSSVKSKGESKVSKNIKNGAGIGKTKIIVAAIAAVVLIGAGIGIAVGISKGNEAGENAGNNKEGFVDESLINQESMGSDTEDEYGAEDTENINSEDNVSESVVAHETFGLGYRWMTRQNFATGQLESAPTDFVFFPNTDYPVTDYISRDDIIGMMSEPEQLSKVLEIEEGDKLEILGVNEDYWEQSATYVYNFSGTDMTMEECLNNNWYLTTFPYNRTCKDYKGTERFGEIFGFEATNFEDCLNQTVQTFGSPTYLGFWGNNDTFMEAIDEAQENGGFVMDQRVETYLTSTMDTESNETICIAWEFEDYVISIEFQDGCYVNDSGEVSLYPVPLYLIIYTTECWEKYREIGPFIYSDNYIDKVYPEGMVMPE